MYVLIVDDHQLIRMSVKMSIHEIDESIKFFEASSFQSTLSLLRQNDIQVVILDIGIPGGEGVAMIKKIRSLKADISILIHSACDEMLYAVSYMKAGANGYLSKTSSLNEFYDAWTSIINNKMYVSQQVQEQLIAHHDRTHKWNNYEEVSSLTPSELIIFQLMKEGKYNKEIAMILNVRENTISSHKKNIYTKFKVKSERELLQIIFTATNDDNMR